MGLTTGFINGATGVDIGTPLVEKSYLMDRYPELADTFKQAGLWGWGDSQFSAQANLTNSGFFASPVQTISGGTNWKEIAATGYAAIKTDGTLWTWGRNTNGSVGDNTVVSKSSPVQTVAGGTNWKQISCGNGFMASIKTDGTLWIWGNNDFGQLGDNSFTVRSSPVQTVSGGTNWKQISCGLNGAAGIKTDGTLWTWGTNNYGQLGNGARTALNSPVQTISGGTNWKYVSSGDQITAAIKTDGSLWLMGYNNAGQLGNNTVAHQSSPVQTVAGGTNWKQVAAGGSTACIKTDGTLWTWGDNSLGTLGDNGVTKKSSPIQTIAGGTNWKQVGMSGGSTISIRDDSSDLFGNPV